MKHNARLVVDGVAAGEIVPGENGQDRDLATILAGAGHPLNTRCGARGLCHGCEVEVAGGEVVSPDGKRECAGMVRACQVTVPGDVEVKIPSRSRMDRRPMVAENFRIEVPYALQPSIQADGGRDTGFAVDAGTTTVVVQVVDLTTGELLARASGYNAQIRFGDNVLTRIAAAAEPSVARAMQSALAGETIGVLLGRAMEACGRVAGRLAGGLVSGNTTMLHLLAGEDVQSLGVAPFVPRFLAGCWREGKAIGIGFGEGSLPVGFLPGISGYVGADITAGVFATGMAYDERPSLLVDAGTNGEMVLSAGGKMWACATAAGPAFEGCGLRAGSRAEAGAVAAVEIRRDPWRIESKIIGGLPVGKAAGICGSAYLDILAEGRRTGLLLPSGRFDPEVWKTLPEEMVVTDEGEKVWCFPGTAGVRVGEVDVALLLQAKAAIAAGIDCLLSAAGIRAGDIGRLCLAGGFGLHMNVDSALAAGLLPGFRAEQIDVVGNSALAGTVLALCDNGVMAEMESLRERVEVLELNLQPGFEDGFIDHLSLP